MHLSHVVDVGIHKVAMIHCKHLLCAFALPAAPAMAAYAVGY